MFKTLLVVTACLAPIAYAGTIAQSNHFIDDLFGSKLRGESSAFNLNGISIPGWTLEKIKSNSLTNRDIKGNFTDGYVRGLLEFKRAGDCSPTAWVGGNITLSCKIDISSMFAEYKFSVKGHTLSGNIKELPAKAQMKETHALFEASSFPNRAVILRTFYVEKMKIKMEMEDLGLNDDRKKNLYDQIEKKATAEFYNVLYNQFSKALNAALNRNGVTLPAV